MSFQNAKLLKFLYCYWMVPDGYGSYKLFLEINYPCSPSKIVNVHFLWQNFPICHNELTVEFSKISELSSPNIEQTSF